MPGRLLLNIRGTSGAGKTTIVRRLIENNQVEHIEPWGDKKKYETGEGFAGAAKLTIDGFVNPVFLIGKYDMEGCGGLDTVYRQSHSIDMAIKYLEQGHVICEGLLTSGLGQGGIFCKRAMAEIPDKIRFLFLDTSLQQCIANVNTRRQEKGNMTPFDDSPNFHLTKKYNQIQNVIRSFKQLNYPMQMLEFERGYDQVIEILREAENESRQAGT